MYYVEDMNQLEISRKLGISKPTVSRLLKSASRYGIVTYKVDPQFVDCIKLQRELMERYPIRQIYVVPLTEDSHYDNPSFLKLTIAIEGARYLQRILSEKELLGLAWGGTVHNMIRALNPCQKKNINVVTMQGDIYRCGEDYDVETLVRRAALTFSGDKYVITDSGFMDNPEHARMRIQGTYADIFSNYYENISISIAGAGGWRPEITSPLTNEKSGYITKEEQQMLMEKGVVADFILHMLDEEGREIESPVKDRTIAIDLAVYRKIPMKIVLLSGENKAATAKAILSGGYADVLFLDYQLAKKLYYML